MTYTIHGTFTQAKPPCSLVNNSESFTFGAISTELQTGDESESQSGSITVTCYDKADLTIGFISASAEGSDNYYQTTAKNIGVKVNVYNKLLKPNENAESKAVAGTNTIPYSLNLVKLSNDNSGAGNGSFTLIAVISSSYN